MMKPLPASPQEELVPLLRKEAQETGLFWLLLLLLFLAAVIWLAGFVLSTGRQEYKSHASEGFSWVHQTKTIECRERRKQSGLW